MSRGSFTQNSYFWPTAGVDGGVCPLGMGTVGVATAGCSAGFSETGAGVPLPRPWVGGSGGAPFDSGAVGAVEPGTGADGAPPEGGVGLAGVAAGGMAAGGCPAAGAPPCPAGPC